MMNNGSFFILIAGSLAAVFFDLENRKIPQQLIIFMWITGISQAIFYEIVGRWNTAEPGGSAYVSLTSALAGMALPLIILWPLFKLRLVGAGDIKLLSALGGAAGLEAVFYIGTASLFFGGGISLAIMLADDSFGRAFGCLGEFTGSCLKQKKAFHYEKNRKNSLHYSVPLFMGVILYAWRLNACVS